MQKRPPIYKVMLHNDNYNRREYVVKILLKVVQAITMDDAVVVMQVGRGATPQSGRTGRGRAWWLSDSPTSAPVELGRDPTHMGQGSCWHGGTVLKSLPHLAVSSGSHWMAFNPSIRMTAGLRWCAAARCAS